MAHALLRSLPKVAALIALLAGSALPLRAVPQPDLFDGLFGKPVRVSRDNIAGMKGKGVAGYRVSLVFAPVGKGWEAFCASLQTVAEKRLRMEGYEVLISRSIHLDASLPSTSNIVVRKNGKMLYFSSLAINGDENGCFVTYEVNTDT